MTAYGIWLVPTSAGGITATAVALDAGAPGSGEEHANPLTSSPDPEARLAGVLLMRGPAEPWRYVVHQLTRAGDVEQLANLGRPAAAPPPE